MSDLKTNLEQILQEKETKIIPENIKKDVEIFGVTGTLTAGEGGIDTSDATATANDIINPKTAYVNGQKITGGIEATYIQQLQDVSMQSITVDSATRIVCVCKTNNVIFTCNATGDITTFYARKFVDNAILEELDSYVIDTGEIYSVSCNDVLNKNGNLSIFFVTRVTSEYCNVYAIEFDLTSGKFKTDTLATLPLLNNSKSWFPYIIVNPLEPDVALTFSMDRHNSYIRTFVYKDNILTGSNIITINDTVARFVEWGTDGKYIISKGYMDTGGNVYMYNYNNNELTLTFNNTYTSPICLYREGYFITDNKLYTQQGQVVKEYTDLGITNQDYCYIYKNLLFIIRNYSSESNRLDIYCINNDYTLSSVFTQDIDWTMNRYFSTVENNDAIGTPYCPVSNTTTLLLSQNGQGYNLSVIPSDNVLLSLKIGNKNYIDVSSAIINDTDVLEGKQFFASISSKRVGTMPNNGDVTITPSTEQQSKSSGYYNSLSVEAVTSAIDSNIQAGNIKNGVTILGVTGTYQGEGVIDYTDNNFEIINNKYLKFKTINYGINIDIESLPQFRIPDEMLGVFMNNKDSLIINMTKDYNRGSLYKFAVYTTTHTSDYLEISCTGTSSSSFQREEVYKLGTGGNFDNPICYAVRPQPDETEINTVIDSTSDFKFNYYEFECDTDTDSYSNFRANTTSSYQDIDVEYLYQAALVGGTNDVESKFYLGTYFTDMNYMNKPASIDNVSMEYKNITDFSVPAMLLNNTQEIHLTSSQLSDTGTAITQDGSWKLTNPEGIITTEIASPTIQSYVRGLNPKGSTSTFSYRMVSDYLGLTYYKNLPYNLDYKLYVDDIEWTGSVDFDVDMKILLVSSSDSEYELYNNSLYSGEYWESGANSISGSNDPTYYWRYACDHIKLVIDVVMNYRP